VGRRAEGVEVPEQRRRRAGGRGGGQRYIEMTPTGRGESERDESSNSLMVIILANGVIEISPVSPFLHLYNTAR
jgi:hypothetical protein